MASDDQMHMFNFTPLKSLFVDGMDEEQIWAQLDLRTKTICRMLDFVLEGESESPDEVSEGGSEDDDDALRKALEALDGGEDVDMDEFLEKYGLAGSDDSDASMEDGDEDEDMGSQSEGSEDGVEDEEGISPLRDSSSDEESGSEQPAFGLSKPTLKLAHKKKRNTATSELDDGFFSLAEFNADTERAESKSASRGRLAGGDDSEDDENTIDFFASVDPVEKFDEDDLENEGGTFSYIFQVCCPLDLNDSQNYFIVISSNHLHAHLQLLHQRKQRQSIVVRSDSMMKSA